MGEGTFIVVTVSFQVSGGSSVPAASLLIPRLVSPSQAQVRMWALDNDALNVEWHFYRVQSISLFVPFEASQLLQE